MLRLLRRFASTEIQVLKSQIDAAKKAKGKLEDGDISLLYKVLKAPVKAPTSGPLSQKNYKLSSDYLSSLEVTYQNLVSAKDEDFQSRCQILSVSLAKPTMANLTELIHVNSLCSRTAEAQLAFDHILELGIKPDLVAHNHLLNAYATVKDFESTERVYNEICEKFTPDLVTYSTWIKLLVGVNRIDDAFKMMGTAS
jgi:pentatricopeptide repeat protein